MEESIKSVNASLSAMTASVATAVINGVSCVLLVSMSIVAVYKIAEWAYTVVRGL